MANDFKVGETVYLMQQLTPYNTPDLKYGMSTDYYFKILSEHVITTVLKTAIHVTGIDYSFKNPSGGGRTHSKQFISNYVTQEQIDNWKFSQL